MLTQHIALVPETDQIDLSLLARVSAALQKQVLRDVAPEWSIRASVDPFVRIEDVPVGYTPIVLTFRELGTQAGVHVDRNGQPFAQVQAVGPWSFDASRACLDLLLNPFENRTISGRSPRPEQATVEYLFEASGPCEDARNGYAIDNILVADFCTPAFFEPRPVRGARYSFNDSIAAPLQLLPGGHLTWFEPHTNSWWLRSHRTANPVDIELGVINRKVVSLRELVQACAPREAMLDESWQATAQDHARRIRQAARRRADRLRAELDDVDESLRAPSVPPPLPAAARAHSRANPSASAAPRINPHANIAGTIPRTSTSTNAGLLVAGSALAGAAVFALGFVVRGPLTDARASVQRDVPVLAASVVSAPSAPPPAVAAEVQAPSVAPAIAPAPVAAASAPAASAPAAIAPAAPAPRAVAAVATRPRVARKARELPSPEPVSARPTNQAAVDDSLDALIGTRQ